MVLFDNFGGSYSTVLCSNPGRSAVDKDSDMVNGGSELGRKNAKWKFGYQKKGHNFSLPLVNFIADIVPIG